MAVVPWGGVSFTAGQTGQAFTFNGTASMRVSATAGINVGMGDGFTLEAWVKPDSVSAPQPILEWNLGGITGVALWISEQGNLTADIPDLAIADNYVASQTPMTAGSFQHVALSYEKYDPTYQAPVAHLFLNGTEAGYVWLWSNLPVLTIGDLLFGSSPTGDLGTGTQFAGQIDEVALYNRVLSAAEIRRLYSAGGGGKCGIVPEILTPPGSQTAKAGNNVALEVVAKGTSLTYQWMFNNGGGAQPLSGATGSILSLMNVQAGQAGTYSVTVANAVGSVTSSGAALTVSPVGSGTPPTITGQPESTSACEGSGFGLTVGVGTHNGSLAYQWRKNGFNINGATSSSYTCSEASCADSGVYSIVVYDSFGQVTSGDATVAVHARPTGTVVADATINPGLDTPILAWLTGTGPWNLTWSDGFSEGPVSENLHVRRVARTSTTTYTLTGLSDANNCAPGAGGLSGSAVVTVQGASLLGPQRAFGQYLSGSHTDFKFGGDMFFLVDGQVDLYGKTTIEGGTVVLFPNDSSARIIIHDPDIVCDTGPYRTASFISADLLHFVGLFAPPAPPPTGYYGQGVSLAFETSSSVELKYLQFFNLGSGISIDAAGTYKLYDCQFTDCSDAVAVTAAGAHVQFYNILFADNVNVFAPSGAAVSAPHLTFQHIMVDNSESGHNFVSTGLGNGAWAGLNSLLVKVANVPVGLDSTCVTLASGSGTFLAGGDGSHYLAADTYQGQGTASIDPTLLDELTHKATHPPLDLPLPFETAGSVTLGPQVPRYASGSQPDLGYYYDALDYTVSSMAVLPGGNVNVLPGTAIGLRNDWFAGFIVEQGASFISHGTPTRPNTFAPVWMVQEGPFPCSFTSYPGFLVTFLPDYWPEIVGDPERYENDNPTGDPPPVLDFRFSNFYLAAGGPSHHLWSGQTVFCLNDGWFAPPTSLTSAMFLQMRDCTLHGGWVNLGEPDSYGGVLPVWMEGPAIPSSVALVNNLFDRVNINLDPDTGPSYWYGGPYPNPTIDLRLTATNNTFRGGWLALEPVKASAGNWVFENNLFDQTVFAQDQYQSLDYDYNAYWPCEDTELAAGQVKHLLPTTTGDGYTDGTYGGSHELALTPTVTPPYEPGPLGDFYLPNLLPSPPQLSGAGSCSPAEVGLYHYTTRADQTKEGANEKVNIGLHYVAVNPAGQPNSGLPQDSDGDGIPDYVEDANGNGVQDAGETDWTNDFSGPDDPPGEDRSSSIYDDVDLDGDGLPGATERALATLPLVQDNPLAGTTIALPDTVSGLVTIPLSIAASVEDSVFMEFTVNGQPAAATVQKVDDNWVAEWDTTLLPNGVYYAAIETQGGDGGLVASPGRLVTVQNAICFPDGLLLAGDTLYVNAQTIYANGTCDSDSREGLSKPA